VHSCLVQFYLPAEGALLPRLVEPRHLLTANSLNALNMNLARLGGPPLGALLVSRLGLVGIALCDAASFLVAGAMAALVRLDPRPDEPGGRSVADPAPAGAWQKAWRDWLAGLRLVRHNRPLAVLFAFQAITWMGEGIMSALFVPFTRTVLRGDATVYGLLLGAQAVGGIVGGVLVGHFGRSIPAPRLLGLSAVLFGLLDLAIFYYPLFWPGVLVPLMLMALVGIPSSAAVVTTFTVLQTQAPEAYRGRVLGAAGTTTALVGLVGMGLAGVLGDRVGIIPLLTVQGGGYVLAGLLVLRLLEPDRSADAVRPLSAAASH
jgi:predicted MFS family arabinose efflux permease